VHIIPWRSLLIKLSIKKGKLKTITTERPTVKFKHKFGKCNMSNYKLEKELGGNLKDGYLNNYSSMETLKSISANTQNKSSLSPNRTRNSSRIAKLEEKLRQWSIVETDCTCNSFTSFRLDDVMADAISMISRIASPKGIEISLKPNHDAIVYADQNMIYAAIQRLISNAVKYSHKGETIKISSMLEQNMVVAFISNSGFGIDKHQLQQLFQVNADSKHIGTVSELVSGIELLLSQRFVEQNHGELAVKSEVGEGVTFTLSLPKCFG
jgi:signal transduction histidine kinase